MLTGAPIQFSTDNKDCIKLLKVFFYILIPAYLIYDIIAGVSTYILAGTDSDDKISRDDFEVKHQLVFNKLIREGYKGSKDR